MGEVTVNGKKIQFTDPEFGVTTTHRFALVTRLDTKAVTTFVERAGEWVSEEPEEPEVGRAMLEAVKKQAKPVGR
jgi:hypothetical protein